MSIRHFLTRLLENKKKLQRGGLGCIFFSGVCLTSISIWFAVVVKKEFNWYDNVPELAVSSDFLKYEYGGCVYAGFILSLLCYVLVWFWLQASFGKKNTAMSMDYSGKV